MKKKNELMKAAPFYMQTKFSSLLTRLKKKKILEIVWLYPCNNSLQISKSYCKKCVLLTIYNTVITLRLSTNDSVIGYFIPKGKGHFINHASPNSEINDEYIIHNN